MIQFIYIINSCCQQANNKVRIVTKALFCKLNFANSTCNTVQKAFLQHRKNSNFIVSTGLSFKVLKRNIWLEDLTVVQEVMGYLRTQVCYA